MRVMNSLVRSREFFYRRNLMQKNPIIDLSFNIKDRDPHAENTTQFLERTVREAAARSLMIDDFVTVRWYLSKQNLATLENLLKMSDLEFDKDSRFITLTFKVCIPDLVFKKKN